MSDTWQGALKVWGKSVEDRLTALEQRVDTQDAILRCTNAQHKRMPRPHPDEPSCHYPPPPAPEQRCAHVSSFGKTCGLTPDIHLHPYNLGHAYVPPPEQEKPKGGDASCDFARIADEPTSKPSPAHVRSMSSAEGPTPSVSPEPAPQARTVRIHHALDGQPLHVTAKNDPCPYEFDPRETVADYVEIDERFVKTFHRWEPGVHWTECRCKELTDKWGESWFEKWPHARFLQLPEKQS